MRSEPSAANTLYEQFTAERDQQKAEAISSQLSGTNGSYMNSGRKP
jgi:hypothetical protein